MTKKNQEQNNNIEKNTGFVPVQYKILKLDANYIVKSPKIDKPKKKGTGTISYYNVPKTELIDWLTLSHGNNGLVSVGDNILFQKIREVKAEISGDESFFDDTPNEQQYKAYLKLEEYRKEIKSLKNVLKEKATEKRIEKLNNKIMEMEKFLFIPDVINVQSNKTAYDEFSKKGFYYAGEKYIRRSAGSGNLKQNTVTFIREEICDKVLAKIRVGFQIDIETTEILAPSKFGAYEGLTTSGCTFVTKPRVVVIPDFEYITFRDKDNKDHNVYYVTKEGGRDTGEAPEYDIGIVPFFETKEGGAYLNSFDGMGFVSPDFVKEKWIKDLHIDYIPSAFNVRSIGVKGLLVTFPFKEFARRKGYTQIIDIRYKGRNEDEINFVDINDVDVILTESQWKYKKLYTDNSGKVGYNFDYYNDNPEAIWGVQRYAPKADKDISRLNYQLVQTSNIKEDDDIQKVVEPTENYLRPLAEGKIEHIMYALLKETLVQQCEDDTENGEVSEEDISFENEDDSENTANDNKEWERLKTTTLNNAIDKNYELIHDAYVNKQVISFIHSILDRAKAGKLYPEHNSNYQFMISDPYGLAQWAFNWFDWEKYGTQGIEDKVIQHIPHNEKEKMISGIGLVPPKMIYSNYWMGKNVSKVDACRSPMTDIAEHNILTVCNYDNMTQDVFSEMETYYKYLTSGIIYSLHDLSTVIHSDSDFDSDMVCTFDSDVFIDNAWDVMPTTYDKGVDNMKPQKYDVEVAVRSDKQGFGNKVGVYSNYSTSLFAMIPMFSDGEKHTDPKYPEYDCTEKQLELYKTGKKNRFIIGEEIDSTKTGQKPEISSDFNFSKPDKDEIRYYNQSEIEEYARKFVEQNELVPKYMPYFFIYVRDNYKEKYTKYKTRMNEACKWYTYESIDNFVSGVLHGTRELKTKDEKTFWEYFVSHCPLLLTECLMNKICWKLEIFEKEMDAIIKENWKDNDRYILMGYAKEIEITKSQEKFIREQYENYINGVKEIFNKKNKSNANSGNNELYQIGKKDALLFKIRTELIKELKVDFPNLFNMLVKALKKYGKSKYDSINSFIWNVMGDDILDVIPLSDKHLKMDDTISADEIQGIEILGKNVVFTWEDRDIGEIQ